MTWWEDNVTRSGLGGTAMSIVSDHLQQRGVSFEVIPHPQAFTSIEEANALGIAADEVLKTVVLNTGTAHALVVIPASRRLDMNLVRDAVGDPHTRLATEDEIQHDFANVELGAVPPLGSLSGASTYVDPEVMTHDTVVFAAGRQTESVKVRTEDLFSGETVTVRPLSRHGDDEMPQW